MRRLGPSPTLHWADLARTSTRALPDVRFAMHYGDRIRGPRLVIGGETSDILLPETVEHVPASGAAASEAPVTGYTPTLLDPASDRGGPFLSEGLTRCGRFRNR